MSNVLAALAMHIVERMNRSIENIAQHGAAAPSAIVVIWQHPGDTIDYLRRVLSLSHSGTVRLVERLVEDGLVVKKPAADARAVALTCTAAGARRARNILAARKQVVDPIIEGLSAGEKRQLEAILRKVPWTGVTSQPDGVHVCRLCNIQTCFIKGNCPVTIARLCSATGKDQQRRLRIQQTSYDPADPEAVLAMAR